MKQFLIDFLKLLERELPPPANCHHGIGYAQFGSDSTGWEDRLALQINVGGVFHCFFLDEADFEKTPARLVTEVVTEMKKSGNFQEGISLGRYV
jgi:hypothetical protein